MDYGPFNGEISDFRVYSNAFTDTQIKELHNSFVRCMFHEDFSTEGADGVSKLPAGWMKSEGAFTIGELAAQDSILKDLKKCDKYLEGITFGYLYKQSTQAYGTWEFCINRTSAVAGIAFISDRQVGIQNGYSLSFLAGVPVLAKYVGGTPSDIAIGGAVALIADTWYKIKITRTFAGRFDVYIKGGAYGNADYTALFTNVVENTVKTSQNIIVVADTGDKITNLLFSGDIS
jgi:hypothetical protein